MYLEKIVVRFIRWIGEQEQSTITDPLVGDVRVQLVAEVLRHDGPHSLAVEQVLSRPFCW